MFPTFSVLGDHYIGRIVLDATSSAGLLSQIHEHIMVWTYRSMSLPCLFFQAVLHVVFNSRNVLLIVQCLSSVLSDCQLRCFVLGLSPLSGQSGAGIVRRWLSAVAMRIRIELVGVIKSVVHISVLFNFIRANILRDPNS